MAFQAFDEFLVQRFDIAGYAERSIVHVATSTTGDLRQFGWGQHAMVLAVEFADACQRNVLDVEVQSHADGVGCNDVVDVAGLIERDLRVARAWR